MTAPRGERAANGLRAGAGFIAALWRAGIERYRFRVAHEERDAHRIVFHARPAGDQRETV